MYSAHKSFTEYRSPARRSGPGRTG
jgi:hypothetical protein